MCGRKRRVLRQFYGDANHKPHFWSERVVSPLQLAFCISCMASGALVMGEAAQAMEADLKALR